ncbi:MAG: transposase [Candidatus Competibacteraceae bacterium]
MADRWHLLKNVREAVERRISRHSARVKQLAAEPTAALSTRAGAAAVAPPSPQRLLLPPPVSSPPRLLLPPPAPSPASPRQPLPRPSRATAQPQRVARYQQVHALHHQGQPLLQIAHRRRMARKTVRRYLQASPFPGRAPRPPGHRQIDRFLPYLRQRWQAGCQVATTLGRELSAEGFTGSFKTVARAVRPWRSTAPHDHPAASPSSEPPSPRQVSWWRLAWSKPKKNNAGVATTPAPAVDHRRDRHPFIQALCERCPAIRQAQRLGNAFIALVREHRAEDVDTWITAVLGSGLVELIGFVSGIPVDKAAVIAALSLPWSNGQTEGQINRVKLIKRQMYGRAKLDLLRVRVLHPP